MKITKKKIGDLNYLLIVNIFEEDYKYQFTSNLLKYGKNINIKGFRKGKAPISILKLKYKNNILFKTIENILIKEINNFLLKNNLNIISGIIPIKNDNLNFNKKDFTFEFEIGVYPDLSHINVLKYLESSKLHYYIFSDLDKYSMNDYLNVISRFLGKVIDETHINRESYVYIILKIFDHDNMNCYLKKYLTLSMNKINDFIYQYILKYKINDNIIIKESCKLFKHFYNLFFYIFKNVRCSKVYFTITIKKIFRIQKSVLNIEFYKKIFGQEYILNELNDYTTLVKKDCVDFFINKSKFNFINNIIEALIHDMNISLPMDFIKKLIKYYNPNISNFNLINNIDKLYRKLLFKFIFGMFVKECDVLVDKQESLKMFNKIISGSVKFYCMGLCFTIPDIINQRDCDFFEELEDQYIYNKIFDFLMKKFSLNTTEISCIDFLKKITTRHCLFI